MKNVFVIGAVVTGALAVAVLALAWWLSAAPPDFVKIRIAVEREISSAASTAEGQPTVEIGAIFEPLNGTAGSDHGSWPRFRGAASDNIGHASAELARTWPAGGPEALWRVELGEGYAGPAIHRGKVYVLDYDAERSADMLRCFSLDDGSEIWRRGYEIRIKRNHGISRTVPAVTDRFVVTIGPKCHVMCVRPDGGELLWGIDMAADLGADVPLWYTGQCPLIDDDIAVLAPCGRSLLVGVDCETGNVLWRTPNEMGWKMSHSSVIPMTLAGRKMYVYCALGGVVGVAADEPDRGSVLWKTTGWNISVVAPSPAAVEGDRVLLTAGYGAGSMMLKISSDNGSFSVSEVARWDRKIFACEQHTPVVHDGCLYTVMPKDAGELREQLVCMSPEGRLIWSSGKANRFGLGPFMIVQDRIFVMDDHGALTMADISKAHYEPLASASVLSGRESWAPFAIAGTRLLARDFRELVCLDLK